MNGPADDTNQQVKTRIMGWAQLLWTKALERNTDFYVGILLHQIQDSYSRSHVARDKLNQVLFFQRYASQSSSKHAEADKGSGRSFEQMPGALDAINATAQIMLYFKSRTPFYPQVHNYLSNVVYKIVPGEENKTAEGSTPQYSCGSKYCGLGLPRKTPSRDVKVKINNQTPHPLTLERYALLHGCWTCFSNGKLFLSRIL